LNDSASSPETAAPETGPLVTVLRTATADKLSPRGGGQLTYQVGRLGDAVLVRMYANESSGRFSKEWVPVEAVRRSLAQLPRGVTSFKGATALKTAWKGLSSCNSGFGAAILKAEGVFVPDGDPKKKGLLRLAAPDALDAWERTARAQEIPADAERLPLNPPKPQPFFAKRPRKPAGEDAAAVEPVDAVENPAAAEPPPDGDAA
jgi:hypothetical protein